MKTDKIYKLIFNEIIKRHPRIFHLDDEHVFITPDGYYGFVFLKKTVPFNLEMIEETFIHPINQCKLTNHYVTNSRLGFVRILKNNDRKIYVNQKYLQYFEDYTEFYQKDDLQLIVAVENGQVVGGLMPIRWTEGDE